MGEVAARTIFSNDTGPLAGTGLDTLAKNQGAILELEGAQAPQSKTITDGSISPTAAYVIVDTEGSAAADDLDVINPALSASENLHDGMIVYLKAADSGRVVTVKNRGSANGINTYDGNEYVLSTTHWFKLQLRSGKWYEVAAASTPATTTSRGICRVATLADMEPGAVVENGPAVIDAKGGVITPTPTAHAVPQADADGTIDPAWMPSVLKRIGGQMDGEILFSKGYAVRRTVDTDALAISGGTGYEGTDATLYLYGKGHSDPGKAGLLEFLSRGTKFSFGANGIFLANSRHVLMHDDIYMEVITNYGPVKYLPVGGTWIFMRVQFRRDNGTIIEATMKMEAGGSPVNTSNENIQLIYAFRVSM